MFRAQIGEAGHTEAIMDNDDDSAADSDQSSKLYCTIKVVDSSSSPDKNDAIVDNEDGVGKTSSPAPSSNNASIPHDIERESNSGIDFSNVEIPREEFKKRIQDKGCAKAELKVKRYKGSMIPAYGPKEDKTYYYDLASIAIDYSKNFKKECELGRGWGKVPKNQTEMKTRVIERLLAMRKFDESKKEYELEQGEVLTFLHNMWSQGAPSKVLHHNDRLRLFGILMSIPGNRAYFERLALGVADKNVLDDDSFHPKNIFQKLTWDFCNESIRVDLPSNAVDVDGWEALDANDPTRIRIHRDCELSFKILLQYSFHSSHHFVSF